MTVTVNFASIQELSEAFKQGQLDTIPDNITIKDELHYEYHPVTHHDAVNVMSMKELQEKKRATWVVYTLRAKDMNLIKPNSDLPLEEMFKYPNQLLLLGWKVDKCHLVPSRAVYIRRSRIANITTLAEGDRPVVGKHIPVQLPQISTETIEAKVDTGANQCCLHATDIKSSGDSVTFVFGSKRITMNQVGTVEIQTADNGGDSRPVVRLKVKTEQGEFDNVEFNLNDRSDMPHKILLGHNFLEMGDFLVDPLAEQEEIDYDWIDEVIQQYC